jgi:hypothetical protein
MITRRKTRPISDARDFALQFRVVDDLPTCRLQRSWLCLARLGTQVAIQNIRDILGQAIR